MASVGQNISTVAYLSSTTNSVASSNKNFESSSEPEDNSMKNKEFSEVMNNQAEKSNQSKKSESSAPERGEKSVEKDPQTETQASSETSAEDQQKDEDGNVLPSEGSNLPEGVIDENSNGLTSEEAPSFVESLFDEFGNLIQVKNNEKSAADTEIIDKDAAAIGSENKVATKGSQYSDPNATLKSNTGSQSPETLGKSNKAEEVKTDLKVSGSGEVEGKTPSPDSSEGVSKVKGASTTQAVNSAQNGVEAQMTNSASDTGEKSAVVTAEAKSSNFGSNTTSSNANSNSAQHGEGKNSLNSVLSDIASNRSNTAENSGLQTVEATAKPANSAAQVPVAELAKQLQIKPQLKNAVKSGEGLILESIMSPDSGKTESTITPLVSPSELPSSYRQLSSATFQTAVPIEVGKPGWSDGVMQKVMWMSSQQISKAEIALDPPELGPLQVRIATNGDQTSVTFTSSHGSVREALDQGVSKLREMMENQGLDLADVDVSDQRSFRQDSQADNSDDDESPAGENSHGTADSVAEGEREAADKMKMGVTSLVDHYV